MRFGARDRGTKVRQPIVAAPLVIVFGRRPAARFFDQSLLEHAVDGSIESAGAQADGAAAAKTDVLNDGVAVAVAISERQQDVKGGRLQGKQRVDVGGREPHPVSIFTVDIVLSTTALGLGVLLFFHYLPVGERLRTWLDVRDVGVGAVPRAVDRAL